MRVTPGDEVVWDQAPQLGKRRSHSDMGIPALWAILTRIAKVIEEKGAHATKVLGMPGFPKRGDAIITNSGKNRRAKRAKWESGEWGGERMACIPLGYLYSQNFFAFSFRFLPFFLPQRSLVSG